MSTNKPSIIEHLCTKVNNKHIVRQIVDTLNSNDKVYLSGLQGFSKNFFASCLSLISQKQLLIITTDDKEAEQSHKELSYLTNSKVLYLPKKELDADRPLFTSSS
ncbi:MAG: hypothetical protein GWN11_12600, partial [Candidatus Dadabacteria bacterium]|nr:hypothetical protein [Candidatus Dadabacteria bacterium]